MSEATKELLTAVKALPEVELREFAEALNESLLDDEDPALEAELDRRWQGFLSGERPGVTAEELAREVEARYGKRP